MTSYPESPDSLNTTADHRRDAQAAGAWDEDDYDRPTARELAEMEANEW